MRKTYFKKSISLIMTVLMVMSTWVFFVSPVEAEAAVESPYGGMVVSGQSYVVGRTDKYGTPMFDGNLDRWFKFSNGSEDYFKVKYPSHIYLDKSETLQSAGYFWNAEWHFGYHTNYRIWVGSNVWGDHIQSESNDWKSVSGNYLTMTNIFDNYGIDASNPVGATLGVYTGSGNGSDDNADTRVIGYNSSQGTTGFWNGDTRHTKALRWKSNSTSDPNVGTIFLMGTPNTTGEYVYSTEGYSFASYGWQENWASNKWNSNKNSMFLGKGGNEGNNEHSSDHSSYMKEGWIEMAWDITIYDKSGLNTAINTANNDYINNTNYTLSSRNRLQAVVSAATTVLKTRATTQDAINAEKTKIDNAINALEWVTADVNYDNLFSFSEWARVTPNPGNGNIDVDMNNGSYTLSITSQGNYNESTTNGFRIEVEPNTEYTFGWTATTSSTDVTTDVYLFRNGLTTDAGSGAEQNRGTLGGGTNKEKTFNFTALPDRNGNETTFVNLRFDVNGAVGSTATFSNIWFAKKEYADKYDLANRAKYRDLVTATSFWQPTRENYTFVHWCDNEALWSWQSAPNSYTASTTLYSDWNAINDINYDNYFSFSEWASSDCAKVNTGKAGSSIDVDIPNGSFTFTPSTAYENLRLGGDNNSYYHMTLEAGEKYIMQYDVSTSTGYVAVRYNDATAGLKDCPDENGVEKKAYIWGGGAAGTKTIAFTAPSESIWINFGTIVDDVNLLTPITYSNISVHKLSDEEKIVGMGDSYKVRDLVTVGNSLSTPTREGYTFGGWYTDRNFTNRVTDASTLSDSATVFSKWTINKYTVKFVNKAGTEVSSAEYDYGTAASAIAKPANTAMTKDNDKHYSYSWPEISDVTGNVTYNEVETPAYHSWDNGSVTTSPTCTGTGTKTYNCTVAGCGATKTETVGATGHGEVRIDGKVEPTCGKDGYTGDTYCTVCGNKIADGQTDPATGNHSWNNGVETLAPTCTGTGTMTYTCTVCSSTKTENIPKLGHTEEIIPAVDATCTDPGSTAGVKCSVCGEVLTPPTVINPLDHAWNEGSVTKEPKCGVVGEKFFSCTRCDETKTEEVAALEHTGGKANCQQGAICEREGCGVEYTAKITDAAGLLHRENHTTTIIVESQGQSCTQDGTAGGWTCTDCGYTTVEYPESLKKTGHNYYVSLYEWNNSIPKAKVTLICANVSDDSHNITLDVTGTVVERIGTATCTTADQVTYKLIFEAGEQDFDSSLTNDVRAYPGQVDPTNHDGNLIEVAAKEATCLEDGSNHHWYCTACKSYYSDAAGTVEIEENEAIIGKLNHDFKTVVDNKNGTHHYKCIRCDETANAGSCDYSILVAEKASTCSEAGYKTYNCSVCSSGKTDILEMIAHTYTSVVTAPTCTAKGYTTYTCSVCNDSYTADETEMIAHTPDEAVREDEVPATCYKEGSYNSVVYCSVAECKEKLSSEPKTIEKIDHTAGATVVENEKAATCTAKGSYDNVVYCSVCNTEMSRETVETDMIAHTYTSVVTAPTCTAKGYTTYTCSVCNDSYTADETEMIAHTAGAVATCTEDQICTVCKTVLEEKLGHDIESHDAKAPTCTQIGWAAYETCSRHDYTTYVEIQPLGHIDENPVDGCCDREECQEDVCKHLDYTLKVDEPTCTKDGMAYKICKVCKLELSATVIPAKGHSEVIEEVGATCQEYAHNLITCANCDKLNEKVYTGNYFAPHTWVIIPGKAPTCTSEGYSDYSRCMTCATIEESVKIPVVPHTDSDNNEVCDTCGGKYISSSKACGCICHNDNFIMVILYKIAHFFWKLFKINKSCNCGTVHY